MISIRENVFETNSSSCHSLTICKRSIREKLENYEALYVGPFENDDSGDIYINEIDVTTLLDRNQVIEKLKEFGNMDLQKADLAGSYVEDQQQWIREHDIESMSLSELVNHDELDLWSVFYEAYDIDFTHPDTIFGGKERNTWVRFEKEVLDPVTKEPMTIALTDMGD